MRKHGFLTSIPSGRGRVLLRQLFAATGSRVSVGEANEAVQNVAGAAAKEPSPEPKRGTPHGVPRPHFRKAREASGGAAPKLS
jgi:hypothetical protein